MLRKATTITEADAILEYFNAFHDGFIKRLTLLSHDVFEERGVQTHSVRPDLEITFAHYNYQRDTRPHDQIIEAKFFQVMDFAMSFSGLGYE